MKIIKKSTVKKAGGGVVVADKLFTAIILLPEDMEKLIYSFLPTPERWGKEMILNRYKIPTFKQMLNAEFPLHMIDKVCVTYTAITNGLDWFKQDSCGNYKIPPKQRSGNIFLCSSGGKYNHHCYRDEFDNVSQYIRESNGKNADADYNMLRDTVLMCKYYLECKKRNDVYRKKYKAEYNEIKCDADGLLTKKFRERRNFWRGKERATEKQNIMPVTEWVNRELKRDRYFANNECYECRGRWFIQTEEESKEEWDKAHEYLRDERLLIEHLYRGRKLDYTPYEPKPIEERNVFGYTRLSTDRDIITNSDIIKAIKGESIPPFIIESANTDAVITVVPDCRQCTRCQRREINSRVAITSQYF